MSNEHDTCPNGCNLQGAPIPQEYLDKGYYRVSATHYSRKIGVNVSGVYDGVLFWMCPDCGETWHRFEDAERQRKAEPHMQIFPIQ